MDPVNYHFLSVVSVRSAGLFAGISSALVGCGLYSVEALRSGHPEDIYIAGVQPCLCWVSYLLCREAEVCFHVCLRNRSISSFSLRSPGPRSVVQPCTEISVSPQFWCYSLRGDYMVLCVTTVILLRENARLLRRIFSNIIIHNTSLIRSVTS